MTKHLRLIMLSLLAMICLGGYSQPKSVVYTFAKEPTLVSGKNIVSKWNIPTKGNTDNNGRGYGWSKPSEAVTATLSADSKVRVTSIVINANTNGTTTTVAIAVGNNAIAAQTIQQSVKKGDTNKNYTYTYTSKEESTDIKFTLKSNKSVWIKTITIYYEESDGRAPTTVKFTGLTGEGVNLIDGKLDGNDFTGYTAKVVGDVAGEIKYTSDNEAVATVDANGQLTIKDYGKATITATFTPVKIEKYAESTASYTVTNTSLQYTSIADLKKVVTADEQSFELKLTNAIVTYVYINNAFIQDESAGIQIYMKGHGLKAKNTFTGIVNVKAKLYNGLAEITSWTSTVTPTQSEVPEPVVVTLAELKGDNYSKYESVRCKVVGVTVTKGMNVQDGEISQNGTVMAVRGGVKSLTMNEGAILDMIGYPSIFNGTKQFQVWKNSDMTEHQTVKEITLYEDRDNTVEAAENVNVTLKRTLVGDGDWNTLCVPFSLTAAQVKAAFGNDVELRKLSSIEGTTLKFVSTDIITAGEPCLIKVAKDGSTYNFEGVATIAVANNKVYTFSKVSGDIQFLGIYSPMDVVTVNPAGPSTGYYAFLGEGNKFFKAQAETKMKGFRAFFLVPNNVPSNALKAVIDGTATGIEDLVIDGVKANGRVYNLNGQYVGNSLNGLQPGLYIQNGKKIVVK
ncbi:hypothetical protein CIK94_10810 [Prevotella sp. P4-51]|uniref:Ig-like domain-containing protein n=1 Tax=Prevotella sp. P4-51 TaxID=2024228 RepID=UPI000B9786E4|nr:Ig-like domain-containing protein [Prevotella sp. P4-51]OYP72234.1 hypothetical protein CIK94_10810 [Prevotella sp. P4-51]